MNEAPDHNKLFEVASAQSGYFTARQAREASFSKEDLKHHVRSGRFVRIKRGLYRFKQYPPSPQDHVVEAWLAAVAAGAPAVVSHETALRLHNLSDVVPESVHLLVPRKYRRIAGRLPRGITVHTSVAPPPRNDIVTVGPVRVTAPARSIVDAADAGTAPDQILLAVRQALDQGLTTARTLGAKARARSGRVAKLIRRAIAEARAV